MKTPAVQAGYPGTDWPVTTPDSAGWSKAVVDSARGLYETLPTSTLLVLEHGRLVLAWGDPAKRVKVSSVRKSFLSALYGIHVAAGRIDLDRTLADLAIDDSPPLTERERTATVRMLLQSRSGVYHAFVGGALADRAAVPARGSHAPGSFWYYNNWDFNALGTIFERELDTTIGRDFFERIARPLQMQDFRVEDVYYARVPQQSSHAAYHFRMTARDMARFGYLFLRDGVWKDQVVIPRHWVAHSLTPYSDGDVRGSYGFMWWIDRWPGITVRSFSARGALGKYIIVVPDRDLVVVYLNHTEFPDDPAAVPEAEVARLPSVSRDQMGQLLAVLLDAKCPAAQANTRPAR